MVASLTLRSALRVAHLFTALRNSPPRLLSTTSTSSVLVYFERPVRPLLRAAGGRRKERVAVDPLAPLDSLTEGRCSGQWMTNITITDRLRIPAHLPPGE